VLIGYAAAIGSVALYLASLQRRASRARRRIGAIRGDRGP
jgi:hypothetical protein